MYNLYTLAETLGEDIDTIRNWPEAKINGWFSFYHAKTIKGK